MVGTADVRTKEFFEKWIVAGHNTVVLGMHFSQPLSMNIKKGLPTQKDHFLALCVTHRHTFLTFV